MWVFTQDGFVSIVRSREDPDVLMVRGRDRESLQSFAKGVEIIDSHGTDYRFRIIATPEQVRGWVDEVVAGIDYTNFKSRLAERRGSTWHDMAMEVWGTVHRIAERRQFVKTVDPWQCHGITRLGRRCRKAAPWYSQYCVNHEAQGTHLAVRAWD
jgi:hypothetical protein